MTGRGLSPQPLPYIGDSVVTVLVDLGNVLVDDFWESMLLEPGRGLADTLGLDRGRVEQVGRELWPAFSCEVREEASWWAMLEADLEVTVSDPLRESLCHIPQANALGESWLRELADRGVQLGIISDNTPFWFARQRELVDLSLVRDELFLLSFEKGTSKRDSPGLFGFAAQIVDPSTTVVVDDRHENLTAARALGFFAAKYRMRVPKVDE